MLPAGTSRGLPRASPRDPNSLPCAQLDDEPLEKYPRLACRSLQVHVGSKDGFDRRAHIGWRELRKLGAHEPAELTENFFRWRARLEHQRQLPKRFGGLPRLDRIG